MGDAVQQSLRTGEKKALRLVPTTLEYLKKTITIFLRDKRSDYLK
jgi:hypothetical protein